MQTLKAAVIGCGGIASEAHIPNCFAIPNLELVALCDRNRSKLEAAASTFGFDALACYSDVDELCRQADIGAFLICTPVSTHCQIAVKAAQAGKHVFVEKPMATNVEEARQMLEAATDAGVTMAVGHYLEFMPHHMHVKERIRAGDIGQVIGATIHDEIITIKPTEGIILDLSPHYIDLLRWYFDDSRIESVFATSRFMSSDKTHLETATEIKMFFANGVIGNVDLYWVPDYRNRDGCTKHLSIIGTEGRYRTSFTTSNVEVYRANTFLSRVRGPYEFVPKFIAHPEMPVSATSFRKELEDFVNSALRRSKPKASGDTGRDVMSVISAAHKSIVEKRTVSLDEV
jgi:UDP-N-acetylglucosamine 3-dehydrogenase